MSWFKKPLNFGITIGAGILFVVSLVFVIYGVVTHKEDTLLRVCWVNGSVRYLDNITEDVHGACSGVEELVWPKAQIPLTVTAIADQGDIIIAPESTGCEGLDAAIRDINGQLGCQVIRARGLRDNPAILARIGTTVDIVNRRDRGRFRTTTRTTVKFGFSRHVKDRDGDLRCNIHISSAIGNIRGEYLVAHHELLHCLGLAHHPNNPSSAMYPLTADDTMWDKMIAARITDGQKAKLRELYCP